MTGLGRTRPSVVTALALAVAAGACGGEGSAERTGPPRAGDPLPAFAAPTLAGDTVALGELDGPLLVNLWATWCAPCRAETPYLQSLYEAHGAEGLRVVGISVDDRSAREAVGRFVEEFGVTYTILHDPSMAAMDVFGVIGLPATYLVDGDGTVTWARLGPVMEGDAAFEGEIERLVGAGP